VRGDSLRGGAVPEVTAYDPGWPARAAAARDELLSRLPGLFAVIEHIGSTAVPGLAAKPVIDLMAAADLDRVAAHDETLRGLGYLRYDTGMPGRLFYYRDTDGRRAYHLHVVPPETWAVRNERLLRDYLRTHPADVARYTELKRQLATGASGQAGPSGQAGQGRSGQAGQVGSRQTRRSGQGRPGSPGSPGSLGQKGSSRQEGSGGYTRGKTELIQELTDQARAERGLPAVPVWEE
jgi:GrpB-like predicted nucleotidyltransferase (UPF0157 family)